MFVPIVLAGGIGKRLYPISTRENPKQFQRFFFNESLLQKALLRLNSSIYKTPLILSNHEYLNILLSNAKEINFDDYKVILEQHQIGTALAIAVSLLLLPEESFVAIFPSDHIIDDANNINNLIKNSISIIKKNIVLLCVDAKYPNKDYGYLITVEHEKFMKVMQFVEKPVDPAMQYGLWNIGIIISSRETLLNEFKNNMPSIIEKALYYIGKSSILSPKIRLLPLMNHLDGVNIGSVDKLILENSKNLYALKLSSNWYDFGNLHSIFDYIKNNFSFNQEMPIVRKLWGNYQVFFQNDNYCIKILNILPYASLSLHYHEHRDEYIQILQGNAEIIFGENINILHENDIMKIERLSKHQLINRSVKPLSILEIQHGDKIDEDDIIRFKIAEIFHP